MKMMNCEKVTYELIDLIDNHLPIELSEEVNKHLHECKSCKHLFDELSATLKIIEDEKVHNLDKAFSDNVMEEITKMDAAHKRNTFFLPFMRYAAVVILGIMIGSLVGTSLYNQKDVHYTQGDEIVYLNEIQAEPLESFLIYN